MFVHFIGQLCLYFKKKNLSTSCKVGQDKQSRMGFIKGRAIEACLFTNRYDAIKKEIYDAGGGYNSRSTGSEYRNRTGSRQIKSYTIYSL